MCLELCQTEVQCAMCPVIYLKKMYFLFKGVGTYCNYWEKALYFIDGWQHQRAIKCYLILRNLGLLNHFFTMGFKVFVNACY